MKFLNSSTRRGFLGVLGAGVGAGDFCLYEQLAQEVVLGVDASLGELNELVVPLPEEASLTDFEEVDIGVVRANVFNCGIEDLRQGVAGAGEVEDFDGIG